MTFWDVIHTSKIIDVPSGMEPVAPSDCSTYCVVCNAVFTYLQQSHGRCPSHKCSVETPAWIPIQHSTVSLSLLIQRFERLNGKSLYLEKPNPGCKPCTVSRWWCPAQRSLKSLLLAVTLCSSWAWWLGACWFCLVVGSFWGNSFVSSARKAGI